MRATDHLSPDAQGAPRPLCIVVTGPPCSGKSWVARHLSERLGLPLITKDTFKETLFDCLCDTQPLDDKAINHAAYELLYATLESLLCGGVSLVVESNFRPTRANLRLSEMFRQHGHAVRQVHCKAPAEVLLGRFRRRWVAGQRHPGHADDGKIEAVATSLREQRYGPLDLPGPLVHLDTTDFGRVDLDTLDAQLFDPEP